MAVQGTGVDRADCRAEMYIYTVSRGSAFSSAGAAFEKKRYGIFSLAARFLGNGGRGEENACLCSFRVHKYTVGADPAGGGGGPTLTRRALRPRKWCRMNLNQC